MRPFKTAIHTTLSVFVMAAIPVTGSGFCFEEAGKEYGISPEILYNIAAVESNFDPTAIGKNKNGSYDYGLMQINSIWAQTLGSRRWAALSDPCTNVKTGAWILSQCLSRYGYTWKGIGCYNSRTPEYNRKYARKIYDSMVKNRRRAPTEAASSETATVALAPVERLQTEDDSPWGAVFRNDSR